MGVVGVGDDLFKGLLGGDRRVGRDGDVVVFDPVQSVLRSPVDFGRMVFDFSDDWLRGDKGFVMADNKIGNAGLRTKGGEDDGAIEEDF